MCCAAISICTARASAAGWPVRCVHRAYRRPGGPVLRHAAVGGGAKQKVVTLEGLGTPEKLHPVQQAFIDEQAAQCGYCINGMIMQAAAFLAGNPKPSEGDIKNALAAIFAVAARMPASCAR